MRRRELLGLLGSTVAAWPLAAHAQQAGKVGASASSPQFRAKRIPACMLDSSKACVSWAMSRGRTRQRVALRRGKYERFPEIAAELVRLNVDVIVSGVTAALPTLKRETTTIPIVMAYSTDPVGNGFAASLVRPAAT